MFRGPLVMRKLFASVKDVTINGAVPVETAPVVVAEMTDVPVSSVDAKNEKD